MLGFGLLGLLGWGAGIVINSLARRQIVNEPFVGVLAIVIVGIALNYWIIHNGGEKADERAGYYTATAILPLFYFCVMAFKHFKDARRPKPPELPELSDED